MAASVDTTQTFQSNGPLIGTIRVPGDKSITHRAILFGLLAGGTTTIDGWLDGADCRSSLRVAQALGAQATVTADRITMVGTAGKLLEPNDVLDCGNSGTTMRIFAGPLAALVPFACITGDDSLRQRPMDRVIEPLRKMGAHIHARTNTYAPFVIKGGHLTGMEYTLPVPSAQVKSAILLAGCFATTGKTVLVEPIATRDHTENMLGGFGVNVTREQSGAAGATLVVEPNQVLRGTKVVVPGDISSAAFLLCAAAIVPGSDVTVQNVGLNPRRTGLLTILKRMGADMEILHEQCVAGEVIGDVRIRTSHLFATEIGPTEIPSLIDELPILSMIACLATGDTVIRGAKELRFKETDRIHAMAQGIQAIGGEVKELEDGLIIHGKSALIGGVVDSFHDHRIAMSFAIAGLVAHQGVQVQHWSCVDISFPTFLHSLQVLTKS